MTSTPIRAPQQDRSRATRQRLLVAAVDSLAEIGWAGSTVAVIAERAGVSRGATQHHFPTREDLITAALAYMSEVRMTEIRRESATLPAGAARTRAVVQMMVQIYTGPLFKAALQVWAIAASEPMLRAQLVPLEARIAREAHHIALELLGVDEAVPGVRETVQGMLDMARGLGLADVLTDDSARRRRVIAHWSTILDRELRVAGAPPAS
jgi:AcrR family transcriptional regulator